MPLRGPMRWFEMSVTPLRRVAGGAVISHEDITRRKQAEIELEQQRQELTHLTRVRILGELSGAMAHELHQPLTAILSNAQAVKRLLHQDPLDLPELDVALDDIVAADKRASDVISRLRLLLKKGEAQFRPLDVNAVINEVLELAHSDLVMRGVTTIRSTRAEPAIDARRPRTIAAGGSEPHRQRLRSDDRQRVGPTRADDHDGAA